MDAWTGKQFAINELFRWLDPESVHKPVLNEALHRLRSKDLEALVRAIEDYGTRQYAKGCVDTNKVIQAQRDEIMEGYKRQVENAEDRLKKMKEGYWHRPAHTFDKP